MRLDQHQPLSVRLAVAAAGSVGLLVPFGLLTAMIAGNVGWLHRLDRAITDNLHSFAAANPGWVDFMRIWSVVFDPNVWRAGTLALAIWLIRRGARDLAIWVAVTMITGGVLNAVLKLIFARSRPDFLDPVARATGYSFPSGHALNSALGAAVILLVVLPFVHGWKRGLLWAAAVILPVVTGLSRVVLGVHWTSDVVGGLILGTAVVAVTAAAFLAGRRLFRPNPATEGLEPDLVNQA